MNDFEGGHEFIYRVTAITGKGRRESHYYISPRKAQFWRNQLRETGFEARAASVPAEVFQELDDATLDALAQEEREKDQ